MRDSTVSWPGRRTGYRGDLGLFRQRFSMSIDGAVSQTGLAMDEINQRSKRSQHDGAHDDDDMKKKEGMHEDHGSTVACLLLT